MMIKVRLSKQASNREMKTIIIWTALKLLSVIMMFINISMIKLINEFNNNFICSMKDFQGIGHIVC